MAKVASLSKLLLIAALLSTAYATPVPDVAPAPVVIYDRRTPNPSTGALSRLEKRSLTVGVTCYTETDCSGTPTDHDFSGTSSSACVSARNCQCMLVTTLDNAHIAYWNGKSCSGNKSVLNGCFSNRNVKQSSPGTNSLGFHDGCTGP
ncbi:hypothetical protein LSUE1_G007112 [Lachnellula suecica]|uniref:Cyanovirin-N domain-containing protein n=1 Tax=Lachnellula suecica TaxID=602035 RepID=A0A8T9C424_9HELO|nr:hypothetical protein LSUE1_G007112 [Lachnellula suecica]